MAAVPNGSVSTPSVVGINFGNTYASIAVFTKEGLAECIANEDGERQISCAVSFQGEEMYIGNQAKHQLVKNSKNTIIGFRNLLGKKFSEIANNQPTTSAPVVQHPTIADEPAYKVEVLQASPSPLPPSTATNTPAASIAPTPRSEPMLVERILTVSEVTTIFIKSLVQSAEDFLGTKVQGAVITVPSWFTDSQKAALESCAAEAGVKVLQLLDERAASIATTTTEAWSSKLRPDRTQLLVDLGASSLSLTLLSIREGLGYVLASSSSTDVGADQLDDALIKFFAADFTKKTKTPLKVAPATELVDQRAEAKLRLAIEHTKRTISASPGAATCSIESLKEGLDYTGTVNRLRFDMLAAPIYTAVSSAALDLLKSAEIDAYDVDEIVYVGGTSCLPGLDEHLCVAGGFSEDIDTPFSLGTVVGGGVGDPTTILARGCAIQAAVVASIPEDEDHDLLKSAYQGNSELNQISATSRTIGLLFPNASEGDADKLGGTWIPVIAKETPLPARRTVQFDVGLTTESKKVACEVWEVTETIRIEKTKPPKVEYSDDEDAGEDEDDEEIEVKHKSVKKEMLLGALEFDAKLGIQAKGKGPAAGTWSTTLQTRFIVSISGSLDVDVSEVGPDGATASLKVPSS
ncbi:Hsp70 protein that interacts with Zuo1p [Pleurotus pulmonarius]|nr:Hsp70 protein that interacts with Zuo1p [Pleurotus pulmonarius]